jgi:hypothetical protein
MIEEYLKAVLAEGNPTHPKPIAKFPQSLLPPPKSKYRINRQMVGAYFGAGAAM